MNKKIFNIFIVLICLFSFSFAGEAEANCLVSSESDTVSMAEQDALRFYVEQMISNYSNPSCAITSTAPDAAHTKLYIAFFTKEIRDLGTNGTAIRTIKLKYKEGGKVKPIRLKNKHKLLIGNPTPNAIHGSSDVPYNEDAAYYRASGSDLVYDAGYIVIDYTDLDEGEAPYTTSSTAANTIIRGHVFFGKLSRTDFFSNSKLIDGGDNHFCQGTPKLNSNGKPVYSERNKDPRDMDLSAWCDLYDDAVVEDCPKKTVYYDKDGDTYGRDVTIVETNGAYPMAMNFLFIMEDGQMKMVPIKKEICEDDPIPAGYVENNFDCKDNDATVYPGAEEICDYVDNDCDGTINEFLTCEFDEDGDGYTNDGDSNSYEPNEDCDDSDASVYPGATEICDGLDNDCDGTIDENCTENRTDVDDDGDGFTEEDGDCDDTDPEVNPDATELCGDSVDNDCDSQVDEGECVDPDDIDNDGDGYTENDGDCVDTDAAINPGATEICDDGLDNDCNGYIDIDCGGTTTDVDGDGYTLDDGDCDDTNASVNPGATEICGDIYDNNCDGNLNEGCSLEVCDDGIDNNGNGAVDCDDSECTTYFTCNGLAQEVECNDLTDNDGDGAFDCADADCFADIACTATFSENDCGDGLDSDGDGLVDCDDEDCNGVEFAPGEVCVYTGPVRNVGALQGGANGFGCSLDSQAASNSSMLILLIGLMSLTVFVRFKVQ